MTSHGIPASALRQPRSGNPPTTTGSGEAAAPAASQSGGTGSARPTPSLPAGVTQAQYQAALQACRSQLPAGGGFGRGGANSAAVAAYRNCLQLHGVTLPAAGQPASGQAAGSAQTPTSATGATTPRGFGGLNTADPTVQAAMQACMSLRPTPSQRSTTSTTAS
jgi:hypothetical protein